MIDFTVLALEGAFGSGVSVTLDMLRVAASLARRHGVPAPTWRVCSVDGGPVVLDNGLSLPTRKLPRGARADRSVWVIPGLSLDTPERVLAARGRADVQLATRALAAHARAGGAVAACCSAVFLLEFAGLLDGRRVTTTWWLAPMLARMNPSCRVDAQAMVCADGALTTGGAAFAQTDLMFHLIRALCGAPLADAMGRALLIDARELQGRFVVPEVLANGDALVARIVERIERALPEPPSVSQLAGEFCVSERTLARHVHRATGQSTLALVQSVRLRRARALLEQSRWSVEQVAEAVGYSDATALRRLMRRVTGASPRQYRGAAAQPGRPRRAVAAA